MRNPEDLTHDELVNLVRDICDVLYLDLDEKHNDRFTPDKEWNGETLESIGSIMERYDLIPDKEAPYS
jgi:hypothetical protein